MSSGSQQLPAISILEVGRKEDAEAWGDMRGPGDEFRPAAAAVPEQVGDLGGVWRVRGMSNRRETGAARPRKLQARALPARAERQAASRRDQRKLREIRPEPGGIASQ
jgi:hypothetical protein